jgi:hypothetical protein
MNLIFNCDDILLENIFFNDSIKNTIIKDSVFIKIIYSNHDIILNGIYIYIQLTNNNNNNNNNNNINIQKINNIEKSILTLYNTNKTHHYKINNQLEYLISKLNNNKKDFVTYILRISGIWETNNIIGITYKFLDIEENRRK